MLHFAVIYKSQSGNKIRLRGCIEVDLLNITINYVFVKEKEHLFSWQKEKQRLFSWPEWGKSNFSNEQKSKRKKEPSFV